MENLLLTIDEARAQIRCSRSFFYQEVKSGRIRLVKLGKASRIQSAELLRYVASKVALTESQPEPPPACIEARRVER